MNDSRRPGDRRSGERSIINAARIAMMFSESKDFKFNLKVRTSTGGIAADSKYRVYQGGVRIVDVTTGNSMTSIDSSGGDVTVYSNDSFTSPRIWTLYIDDVAVSSKSTAYRQAALFRVPIQLLFPPANSNIPKITTEQKPRYLLKSPVQNGAYTESVSFLTGRQVSDYRSRGFIVENTTRAITPAIRVTGNPTITTIDNTRRMPRKGIVDSYSRFQRKEVISAVMQGNIPKSYYNPRRIFAESKIFSESALVSGLKKKIQAGGGSVPTNINRPAANAYYADYNRRATAANRAAAARQQAAARAARTAAEARARSGSSNSNRYTPVPESTKRYSYTIVYPSGYVLSRTNVASTVYAGDRGGNGTLRGVQGYSVSAGGLLTGPTSQLPPGVASNMNMVQGTQGVDAATQSMQQELKNLKAWLQEVNQRLSGQVVDLGQSTTDRDRQIQELSAWTATMNDRVSKQLVDLGNASTDASKAIEVAKAQNVVNQVKAEKEPGIWDKITGGVDWISGGLNWDNLKKYSMVGIIIIVLIIALKFGANRVLGGSIGSRSPI